ncbi:MAG: OadG family protein, partial [Bacteroidales bacterium]|nr:OadG family protein [Bacteroidales bacterium]
MLIAGLFSFSMLTAMAQGPRPEGPRHGGPAPKGQPAEAAPHEGCPMQMLAPGVNFTSVKVCYVPQMNAFVAVDSVECCVHMVAFTEEGKLDTVGSFKTDNTHKRHDLKNILRPVSVGAMGDYILVLASAINDSAYVAILDKEMHEMARRAFRSPMYAMHREHGVLMVVGRNPYGYDINLLPLHRLDFEAFANGEAVTHHYRVAKQSEKIKQSDPIGIGLAAVAVSVVFLALVCIYLLISGSGKLIMSTEERQKKKGSDKKAPAIKPVSKGSSSESEVVAAIAAAIHLYNDELHDEEETVIT